MLCYFAIFEMWTENDENGEGNKKKNEWRICSIFKLKCTIRLTFCQITNFMPKSMVVQQIIHSNETNAKEKKCSKRTITSVVCNFHWMHRHTHRVPDISLNTPMYREWENKSQIRIAQRERKKKKRITYNHSIESTTSVNRVTLFICFDE